MIFKLIKYNQLYNTLSILIRTFPKLTGKILVDTVFAREGFLQQFKESRISWNKKNQYEQG